MLHVRMLVAVPLQSRPPKAGFGLSHTRVLFRVPLPQGVEQAPKVQLDQLPSTGKQATDILLNKNFRRYSFKGRR